MRHPEHLPRKQVAGSRGLSVRRSADAVRLFTMSIADVLNEWFVSPEVKGLMAVNGIIGSIAAAIEQQGATTSQIALRLGVSQVTVRTHVSGILRKLRVPTREAALALFHDRPPA